MSDVKVTALLEKVETQKAALGTKPRATYHTNAIFKFPDGKHLNLNTVKNFSDLITALGFLLDAAGNRKEAAERLGIEEEPFKWSGFTIDEWEHDFKLRIAIVQYDARKKQLEATKKKLKELYSEAGKTAIALDEIESLLG